jgi:hypothetical protein
MAEKLSKIVEAAVDKFMRDYNGKGLFALDTPLYTSFYKCRHIDPKMHATIRISNGHPRWHRPYKDAGQIKELMPDRKTMGLGYREFSDKFSEKMLVTDWQAVFQQLRDLSGDRIPVLMCFESVNDCLIGKSWCHRHLVAAWIRAFVDPQNPVEEL